MTESNPPVAFVYSDWIAMFPEFSVLSEQQANGYFLRAGLQFANSRANPAYSACDNAFMIGLFYLLTAHIAWLYCPKDASGNPSANGDAASQLVGRINSATQGSVSVQVEYQGSGSPNEAYYLQSKYGAEYFNATAQFRTARYLARPTIVINGTYPGLWNQGGFFRR